MTSILRSLSAYWLWAVLSLPAAGFLAAASGSSNPEVYEQLLHPTGEFSARFMILAMLASPLMMIFKGWRGPLWLKKNRRYFGVAAFGYAALHTAFYLVDSQTLDRVLGELPRLYIWTGWLAFLIFIPLALTSMDVFVRILGPSWKKLQRWTYAAAVLTLLHWAALHEWGGIGPALVHFGPLGLLEGYRLWYWNSRRRTIISGR